MLFKKILQKITDLDTKILFKIKKRFKNKELTHLMKTLTFIGSAGFVWLLPTIYLIKNRKSRLLALNLIGTITTEVLLNNLVTKLFFHRKRPLYYYPEEYYSNSLPLGYSFPSGHALTSFSALVIYSSYNPLNVFWALPLTLGISFSRAYLFTHYPSDIIVGAFNGTIIGLFSVKYFKYLKENNLCFNRFFNLDNVFNIFYDLKNPRQAVKIVISSLQL